MKQNEATLTGYLRFVQYAQLSFWDVKRYTRKALTSPFEQVVLSQCIQEENQKYKLFEAEEELYGILGVNNKTGIFDAYTQVGKAINQAYKEMQDGWIAYNPYRINVGSVGIKRAEHCNRYISPAYVVFSCKKNLLPEYLYLMFRTDIFNRVIIENTTGSVRQNLTFDTLQTLKIPLPSLPKQQQFVQKYYAKIREVEALEKRAAELEAGIEEYFGEMLGIKKQTKNQRTGKLVFIHYSTINEWGTDKIIGFSKYHLSKYETHSFMQTPSLLREVCRGKSPQYVNTSTKFILNQKCNRWNEIDLSHVKSVDEDWLEKLDKNSFTRIDDILINSTGEGTIGRASVVKTDNNNLMYDSHILLLRVNINILFPEFFVIVFNSAYGQEQVNAIKSAQSTKQTELGIANLQKIEFPLPPLPIQHEITDTVQKMRQQITALRDEAEAGRREAEREFEGAVFLLDNTQENQL